MSAAEHATEPLEPVVPFGVSVETVDEDEYGWREEDEDLIDDPASAESWEEVVLNKISDLNIEDDPLEKELLCVVEKEWKAIFKDLKDKARSLGHEDLSDPRAALHVYAQKYVSMVLEHVHRVHSHGKPIPVRDILDFLCMECVCAFLNISPTVVYREKAFESFILCPEATYFKIYQALGKNPDHQEPYAVSRTIENIEHIVSESCRWAYNKHSVIALDDDKAPVSGVGASALGVAARKIKKNFNPVIHTCVSVLTSVFLSAHLEQVSDTVEDCINSLILKLSRKEKVTKAVLDNLFTKDRGYNTMATSSHC